MPRPFRLRLSPLTTARHYVADGIANYEYARCKQNAKLFLMTGDLDSAIHETQVALFISRIQKVS